MYTRNDLSQLTPRHDAFVGIDSDGCVFPTMEIKQKQCFHGLIVSTWHLEPVEAAVRAAAEFVNLYSQNRGQNRFTCLLLTFELLREHPAVKQAGIALPSTASLKAFCDSGRPLSNPELEQYVAETRDPELTRVLTWSHAVNARVAATVKQIPPFRWAHTGLEHIRRHADAICVSQTPTEALIREWEENQLMDFVTLIAGQELGTKAEHLTLATQGRYRAGRVLMIGDAPGDLKAARQVGARFFPINPGHEEASWETFCTDAFPRFLNGTYSRSYEDNLIRQFNALLPDTPPWVTAPQRKDGSV